MEPSLPAQAEREYLQILFPAARESQAGGEGAVQVPLAGEGRLARGRYWGKCSGVTINIMECPATTLRFRSSTTRSNGSGSATYVAAASADMSPGRGWIDWQPAGRLSRESCTRILINA